jgi:glycosyltransferase involved in cell wall biosynthesis
VLIIVQNLSVPLDRRVWLECLALRDAGYEVAVICPAGPGEPPFRVLEGVRVHTYPPAPAASGVIGYAVEFTYSWLRTALLSLRVWREVGFDVIQACNPPDTYWALARLWRVRGVRFVFDHHDLNPELFLSRFGVPRGVAGRAQLAALRWLERRTYAAADRVIATNESYRRVALSRGGLPPASVVVVRSGPDTTVMRPVQPPGELARPRLLVYLGIMGPQDGVDQALLVMDELVHRRGRSDVHLALLGFGDCYEELRAMCTRLGLDSHVTFTGRADPAMVADYLSSADVGVCPDLRTPLNDVSTMNKVMEYMAYCLPAVSFDLTESRVSAGGTALFVDSGDVRGFADAVERLLDDDDLRVQLGLAARARVAAELDWASQRPVYVRLFDQLLGRPPSSGRPPCSGGTAVGQVPRPSGGRRFVPLDDPAVLAQYVRDRGRSRAPSALEAEEAHSA